MHPSSYSSLRDQAPESGRTRASKLSSPVQTRPAPPARFIQDFVVDIIDAAGVRGEAGWAHPWTTRDFCGATPRQLEIRPTVEVRRPSRTLDRSLSCGVGETHLLARAFWEDP